MNSLSLTTLDSTIDKRRQRRNAAIMASFRDLLNDHKATWYAPPDKETFLRLWRIARVTKVTARSPEGARIGATPAN